MIRHLIAYLQTSIDHDKIQEQKDAVRAMEQEMLKAYPTPQIGPFVDHPGYADHLVQCLKNFRHYAQAGMQFDNDRTWGIGDSILAQAKPRLTTIRPELNMALGGMWAHHMLKLIDDMSAIFHVTKFVPKTIVVGSPGGNNLLNRQDLFTTSQQFLDVLDKLRFLYPNAKIIIYGLPMTINSYVIQAQPYMYARLVMWVKKDVNATYLALRKRFKNKDNRLFPDKDHSSDGVHLTPLGQLDLDADIRAGKKAKGGSVIP